MILKVFKYPVLCIAAALILVSCGEEEKKAGPRKRMPAAYFPLTPDSCSLGMMQQNSAFPFDKRVVDLSAGDVTTTTYYRFALPDTIYDALASGMVEKYRHMAKPMLEQWLQSERKGILLDLCSNANELQQADYLIQLDSIRVPLEIYWDEQTATRSARYLDLINTIPGVKVTAL
ncbi:hypothetical protein [Chitinophaga sp. Cy-1792]|uniref:hypothetical protein n=1 Tax=Chitinophaga sp. Cy-1792 TaxID=2608339 RepID=UPI00142245F9|nr:hypothetical protein [Chitinophaga sp. Cy-1792]NIG53559.1 hypothetical protein [Chitinophaga sp. Cy-1792]